MGATIGTITTKGKAALQANFVHSFNVTFDSSYPTGGEALALSTHLAGHAILLVKADPVLPYSFGYDYANDKLKVYEENGTSGVTAEVAPATDLSALTVGVRVLTE